MVHQLLFKLDDLEWKFVGAVQNVLLLNDISDELEVYEYSNGVLNFSINQSQLGRVKLRGRKYRVQITGGWDEDVTYEYALTKIPEWVKAYKDRIDFMKQLEKRIKGDK